MTVRHTRPVVAGGEPLGVAAPDARLTSSRTAEAPVLPRIPAVATKRSREKDGGMVREVGEVGIRGEW